MHRSLAQFVSLELIRELREECPRRGEQGIVLPEPGEVQQRLSVKLVSRHAIPDALHCFRNGLPDRGAHLFELRPNCLGLRRNVLVNRLGNALSHFLILSRRARRDTLPPWRSRLRSILLIPPYSPWTARPASSPSMR